MLRQNQVQFAPFDAAIDAILGKSGGAHAG
jgi:hypothetical protein